MANNLLVPKWRSAWTQSPGHTFSMKERREEYESFKPGPNDALLSASSQIFVCVMCTGKEP